MVLINYYFTESEKHIHPSGALKKTVLSATECSTYSIIKLVSKGIG